MLNNDQAMMNIVSFENYCHCCVHTLEIWRLLLNPYRKRELSEDLRFQIAK